MPGMNPSTPTRRKTTATTMAAVRTGLRVAVTSLAADLVTIGISFHCCPWGRVDSHPARRQTSSEDDRTRSPVSARSTFGTATVDQHGGDGDHEKMVAVVSRPVLLGAIGVGVAG